MKTPREILLRRHEAVELKLDRVRESVLTGDASTVATRPASFLSTLNSRLSTFLWPSPWAWGGVAATWLVIAALNHSASLPGAVGMSAARPPISPELMRIAAAANQRIMRELLAPESSPVVPPPQRPRGQNVLAVPVAV